MNVSPIRALMLGFLLLAVALALPGAARAAAPNTLTPDEIAEGWILLFDGESLFGWRPENKADWRAGDGAISATEGDEGLLRTTGQWGNYVLKVDFRIAPGGNSGVFLRTPPVVTDVKHKAYEVNIAGADNAFPTGSLVQRQKAEPVPDTPDWHAMEITADASRFVVRVDGKQVLDYTDPTPLGRGYIGLQFRSGKVEFRNVKLKPLGMKSLFNGRDLAGWKTYPEMKSIFSVTPGGEIHVKDGRGQLETADQYGDFTMQLEVFVNGKALNSGVFYRCIPGEVMNGYECQIHNAFKDGDRTKPVDCGTGGIFRRQDARRVVPDDFQWFSKTIHVDGPHVAVWVNGYQVSDWTDRRKPDPNPRKGLRVAPGTIMLQGHDPTTDLSFRNLRIAEIPKR
jgi:hypothetical protein